MSNRRSGSGPGPRMSMRQILLVVAVLLFLWFRSGQGPADEPVVPAPATVQVPGESMADALDETFDGSSGAGESSGFEAGELDAITDPAATPTAASTGNSGDWQAGSVSTEAESGAQGTASQGTAEASAWSSGDVSTASGVSGLPTILYADLPDEAKETIRLIDRGGPFPYDQDGSTFQNRERILPARNRGYYQEFTVISPWESDRGARRIVAGADGELYYTDDHYDSFREVIR